MAQSLKLYFAIASALLCTIGDGATPPLSSSIRAVGEWAACTSSDGNSKGMCINTLTQSCSTATVTGRCPGPAEVRCCLYPAGAKSSACSEAGIGVCTLKSVCPTTPRSGLCPGPSDVLCCPKQSTTTSSCTLGTALGCSTAEASGLTSQLVSELIAMGYSFATFSGSSTILCTSPCEPFLQTSALAALNAAVGAGKSIRLNSAYRSSAQQFLLYHWRATRPDCGLGLVAKPGTSNHEGGLAIDTSEYSKWITPLSARSWKWYGSRDKVHFDYIGTGGRSEARRESLRAFQRLWNRNNPGDIISEDGIYGSNTEARLLKAPCGGW